MPATRPSQSADQAVRPFVERRRHPNRRKLNGRRASDPSLSGEMKREIPPQYFYVAVIGAAAALLIWTFTLLF